MATPPRARRSLADFPDECIRTLCMHLVEPDPTGMYIVQADRKRLVNLARTCRTFYHPAIEVLWGVLYTIVPLFYTLPADLLAFDYDEDSDESAGKSGAVVVRDLFLSCMTRYCH